MTNDIQAISFGGFRISASIDYEYQQIIRRLARYGLKPSGSKSIDRARLHEKELEEAEKENCVSSKFLTVTENEQEKIQEKKKEKRIEANPELDKKQLGQEILGQQIMIAIEMKDKFKVE
jgi:hypothetical protein